MHGQYQAAGLAVGQTRHGRRADGAQVRARATSLTVRGRAADSGLRDSDSVTDLGAEPTVGPGDGDIPVPIGPTNDHAEPIQLTKQRGSRLAIIVMRTDRDHREPSMYRREERMIRISAAVMWNLEHVGRNVCPHPE